MSVCCHQLWSELSRPLSLKDGTDTHYKISVTNKSTLTTTQKREDLKVTCSILLKCWQCEVLHRSWNSIHTLGEEICQLAVGFHVFCFHIHLTFKLSLFVWQFVPFLSCCYLFVHYILSLPLLKGYKEALGSLDIIFLTTAVELLCLQCYCFLWHPYFIMKCHAIGCDCTLICIWHFPFLHAGDEVDRNSQHSQLIQYFDSLSYGKVLSNYSI
jgi:hypothetical protein